MNRQRRPLQVVDQPVVQHRGPDRAVLSVQLPDPVTCDLVGLHLGQLDQQVELRIDLLHGGPKLEGEILQSSSFPPKLPSSRNLRSSKFLVPCEAGSAAAKTFFFFLKKKTFFLKKKHEHVL